MAPLDKSKTMAMQRRRNIPTRMFRQESRMETLTQRPGSLGLADVGGSESGDYAEVMELPPDFESYARCGPDANTLETIRFYWEVSSERCPPQMSSLLGFILDRPWVIGTRLNEYQALIVAARLVSRGKFYRLGLYTNLLGQGSDKWWQGTDGTHLAVTSVRSGRVSDTTQRHTMAVLRSLANCPTDVERPEQRVAIHWNEVSAYPISYPVVRTPSHEEIEANVYESVRQDGDLDRSRSGYYVYPGTWRLTEIRDAMAQRLVNIPV